MSTSHSNTTPKQIIAENIRRNNVMFAPFNPITGEGSTGQRVKVHIPDFPIPDQWLPIPVAENNLVKLIIQHKGMNGFLKNVLRVKPTTAERAKVVDQFIRLRSLHDFPFWAASFVYIKNKEVGQPDCLFRLTYPQRRFVERLEQLRLANRPIRIVLLKARQWGGSTTSQLYMAWLQLIHRTGLNSLIISNQNKSSETIKAMFKRMIDAYPTRMLHDPTQHFDPHEPKLVGQGRSGLTQLVPQRNATISIGSAESPDSCRGGDYALVHLSEVGLWKAVEGGKNPEDIVRSACSGVLYRPYTMIVYESTANGVGNFFYNEYTAAKDPRVKSQFEALFVPWFDIELYRIPFDNENQKLKFAQWLFDNRNNPNIPSDREEPGKYLWWLWNKGASLEGIKWYIEERAKYHDHGSMASEYPSDDIEAFVNSGSAVFDKYAVEAMKATCKPPIFSGDIYADADEGPDALRDIRFREDKQGLLDIWQLPDNAAKTPDGYWLYTPPAPGQETVANRYLTVVDVGGRSAKADWSVILVIDRLMMLENEKPAVVAQWYGHIDMDILAWKAAQIAAFYDNALLVIESNTLETHDRERNVDGDQSGAILNQIRDTYPNLYARAQSEDAIRQGLPVKYGFHTNTFTKPLIISTLVKVIREQWYIERDSRCINEYLDYEKKPNGAFGAMSGKHDDLLMTRAIGLHICFYEMDKPQIVTVNDAFVSVRPKVISEASF